MTLYLYKQNVDLAEHRVWKKPHSRPSSDP